MTRLVKRLAELRTAGEGALVCFVTAGDPDLQTSTKIVLALAQAGADVIELGIPFSDPIADGPSIQASSMRALLAGTTVRGVLGLVREVRKTSDVPLVLMTYYNPVQRYGLEQFACDAANTGADGVILTDLTVEESGEWKKVAERHGLNTIFLLAPTSTDIRIRKVAKVASGFVYCVSRTGVTGERTELASGVSELVARIKASTDLPVLVGFGVSKPEHVREVCSYADGAVVGSALVNLIAEYGSSAELFSRLSKMVAELKAATKVK
ncbi:MAG: tryptophan synthase subunit alpha [Armatimonadota bacterium]|nr:tryptophan synthase subunit alpha [Armatimonadota bacterium]